MASSLWRTQLHDGNAKFFNFGGSCHKIRIDSEGQATQNLSWRLESRIVNMVFHRDIVAYFFTFYICDKVSHKIRMGSKGQATQNLSWRLESRILDTVSNRDIVACL